jgi:hypothetical protein
MQPTVDVDIRTVRDLDNAISAMALLTGKSMGDAISHGSYLAARSAAASIKMPSPIRKSSRRKSMFGSTDNRLKKGVPSWAVGMVEVWSKGQPRTVFAETHAEYNAIRRKPRRGLARNVWRASSKSTKLRPTKEKSLSRTYSTTEVKKSGGFVSSVAMSNKLSYIQKIAPNSARIGVHKATKYIEGFAIPRMQRKILRQFYSQAARVR